jgi:MarR family transcriptional regulator, organic hydroperoxide resistance regulator
VTSTQQHQPQPAIELPSTFETSGAKLVYLYLDLTGEATIDELQAALGMRKVTLYSLLQTLTATDLVDREGTEYVCQKQTPDGENA